VDTPHAGITVGVVGLGAMGLPISGHLARAGCAVTVHDRDPDRVDRAVAQGCTAAPDSATVASHSAVTLVIVPSDDDVRAVCLDEDEAREATGGLLVVCSSVHPRTVRDIAQARGGGVLDAALTGGLQAAADGTVNLLVGGAGADLAAARPVLDPWCATVHHLGPLGAGQIAKSANNLVHWAQICAIEEALDLARRHGLSVPAVRAALTDGPTDSRTLRELERMRLTWWAKDLESLDKLGEDVGRPLPVADMCRATMPAISVASLRELLGPDPS
jgi:3-hydroxyisobutyrate dehydrogenase-like beta-hydroxyacid dehydrogenase